MSKTFLGILKFRNFSKLWVAQITSQVAHHMLNFAILLHIYDLTKSSASISLVLIASAIPSVIFGPFSGVIADRFDFKKILTYTNILRFLAVLLLFVVKDNVLGVLEIIFIIALFTQFFSPAENATIPLIVPKEKLVAANSVIMTTMYGALLIGYSIAGPLMSWFSPQWLFLLCALLYLASTWAVNSMRNFDKKEINKITLPTLAKDIENIWRDTKSALPIVFKEKRIFSPMMKLTYGWAMFGSFIILMPSFGENVLNILPKYIGPAIVAPAGVGMLLGAYILDKKKKFSISRAINKSFIVVAAILLIFSLYGFYEGFFLSRLISTFLIIGLGAGTSIVYISAQTALHVNSKGEERGRVFGISTMLINLAMSIPAVLMGGIADATSPYFAMIMLATITGIYGLKLLIEKPIAGKEAQVA